MLSGVGIESRHRDARLLISRLLQRIMGEVNHVVFPLLGDKTARLAHRDMGRGVNHLGGLSLQRSIA